LHRRPVSELRASLAAFRVCSFDSHECVMLFSENKYDDDDDDLKWQKSKYISLTAKL